MRAVIHYTAEIPESVEMANESLQSFQRVKGWEPELRQGFTPYTAPELPIMPGGYLDTHEGIKRRTKVACVCNHLRFWFEVTEPMAFVEHDAICIAPPPFVKADVTHLAYDTAKHSHIADGRKVTQRYFVNNHWHGARLFPGTAAYVATPEGARKLLSVAFNYGLEQSDWIINSKVVEMEVARPSPVKLSINYLNSSSGKHFKQLGVQ